MKAKMLRSVVRLVIPLCWLCAASTLPGEVRELKGGSFVVEQEIVLPASPDAVFDAVTGDISGWWDHSFSQKPRKLYIEPRPGGGFYEIFNDAGDGALHATVIFAERGKRLRFVGPFGFSGQPVQLVVTYSFMPDPQGTRFHVTCSGAGPFPEGSDQQIDAVWHHFLFERLKPYIETMQRGKGRAAD
jgi:uncharacterized protein YndB with AHSA1/START domain